MSDAPTEEWGPGLHGSSLPGGGSPVRRRDAVATRTAVLLSARRCFAKSGYDGAAGCAIAGRASATVMLEGLPILLRSASSELAGRQIERHPQKLRCLFEWRHHAPTYLA